jgi:hypothetical protein
MMLSTRCVAASSRRKVIAIGTRDGRIYPLPVGA